MPKQPLPNPPAAAKEKERWDFHPDTVKLICDRAAARCANPNCRKVARIPAGDGRILNLGEAAHIFAASEGGPRTRLPSKEATVSVENGLWLCVFCHRTVDRNPGHFTVEKLYGWKAISEKEFNYESPTLALSLPAQIQYPQFPNIPHIGLHLLVGPSRDLRAVCHRLSLEVFSQSGFKELPPGRTYTHAPGSPGTPVIGEDWHNFMLTEGTKCNLFFGDEHDNSWLTSPAADRIIVCRLKAYSRLGSEELEPFVSPWVVGILSPHGKVFRVEWDYNNSYSHILEVADLLAALLQSPSGNHQLFARHILALQDYRKFPQAVVTGQSQHGTDLKLLSPAGTTHNVVTDVEIQGGIVDGAYDANSYVIRFRYQKDPTQSEQRVSEIQEFWNGGGGVSVFTKSPDNWKNMWRAEQGKWRLVSDGTVAPRLFNQQAQRL